MFQPTLRLNREAVVESSAFCKAIEFALRQGARTVLCIAAFGGLTALAPAAILPPAVVADVPHGLGMHDLGRSPGVQVRLALVMSYRNRRQLDAFLNAPPGARSAASSRVLSAEAFRASFSPTPETYARTVALLQRAGFTVTHSFANRTVIDAGAPAAVVERYFHTEIHRVAIDGLGVRYANARTAYLPEELRGAVYAVVGFDDIEKYRTLAHEAPAGSVDALMPTVIGPPLTGPKGGYGPLAFAQGYDLPVQHGYDGSGHRAGITIDSDPQDSDLNRFLAEYKITRTGSTSRIAVDGGPTNPPGLEATLDYETIAGLAPGAHIDIFEIPALDDQYIIDAYNAAVSDNLDATINSSFAGCESSDVAGAKAMSAIFEQGRAQGQTFHAATGDSGTKTGCAGPTVNAPASSPYDVAVGGTELTTDSNGNWQGESYWDGGPNSAGGGGVSVVFGAPLYQKDNGIHYSGRALPDLSFNAGYGESIVYNGKWEPVGGTSLASPIFGACLVDLVSEFNERPSVPISLNLYSSWYLLGYKSGNTVIAHDITTGTPYGDLKPAAGYDLATGIGSLDCYNSGTFYFY